jgi:hypothetical protein
MFRLEGKDRVGNWDVDNVSSDVDATHFENYDEALAELEYFVNEGRDREDFRIVEQ